jgi:FkbM family methyltransferase
MALSTRELVRRAALTVLENPYTRPYVRVLRPNAIPLAAGEVQLAKTLEHFGITKVLDVGANSGQYAQLLRNRAGYLGNIISIEPGATQAEQVRRLAQLDPRWSVLEVAIGEKTGQQMFNVMNESQFNSLLEPDADQFLELRGHKLKERVQVSVLTLSDLLDQVTSQDVSEKLMLKLDTQGTELSILRAGSSVLKRFCVIQSEVSFRSIYQNGASFHEVSSFLEEAGFRIGAIFANNSGHFPRLYDADAIFVRADLVE